MISADPSLHPITEGATRKTFGVAMSDPVLDIPSPTRDEFKQELRLRRFLFASAFSVLYVGVLAVFYTQDMRTRA
ncbi:MAG: hypothetical protein E6H74_13770 [Betaproteobacteria bacterium]|nr:MAG: hypothetical protein E6H74_13770 [Betaproteobacteria bacterium]